MSYATINPEGGAAVINLLQIGDVQAPKVLSQSAQRIGSAQPVFYQVGQRADRSQLELRKVETSLALATADRDALEFCQGRKVVFFDKDTRIWNNVFVHTVKVRMPKGAGGVYLVECMMELEALPETEETQT